MISDLFQGSYIGILYSGILYRDLTFRDLIFRDLFQGSCILALKQARASWFRICERDRVRPERARGYRGHGVPHRLPVEQVMNEQVMGGGGVGRTPGGATHQNTRTSRHVNKIRTSMFPRRVQRRHGSIQGYLAHEKLPPSP